MTNLIIAFITVAILFFLVHGFMDALDKTAEGNTSKKRLYYAVFFAVCAFFYFIILNQRDEKNKKINDYLYKIEQANDKVGNTLDEMNLYGYVEDELSDIYEYIQETYSLIDN